MKSRDQRGLVSLLLLIFITPVFAQDQRIFNQNASRSNHGLSISFSPLYSIATNTSSDSLLFRGNGAGFRFGAEYFFGKAGISFSSGFGSSSADDATINNFLKRLPFAPSELIITKARQQNMYLLLGPSLRVGNTVELSAHAQGGLFINNGGLINIQQKGAQRSAYRNESTAKSIYPGFITGAGVQYKTKSDIWSFGITMDYMNTRTEVNNYDARRGGGIEALKLSRNITDLVTGVVVRYNILSPRDHASGQASGKRQLGKPKYEDIKATPRDIASGMPTGKTYQPGRPVYGNLTVEESCGAVTQKTTNPDGSTEEMTFACPADAAAYNDRISMNVTVPKQTQGATFGEKVNAGLHAAGGALAQGARQGIVHRDLAARNIISGRLSWSTANSIGIITNESAAVSSVGNLSGGGGAAAASYAATGRMAGSTSGSGGSAVTIYARDAASGQATGKRSRDAASGMATGRRQYQPIFVEGQGDVCNPCLATAKMTGTSTNPLYKDNGMSGSNPLYQGKERTPVNADEDCDGISDADIILVDAGSGEVVAKTKTERCGNFFFANVPEGTYVVKLSKSFTGKKGYDVYLKSKTDLRGGITAMDDWDAQLLINTNGADDEMEQKAGISTSRSNIRSKSLTIIEADLDGDGEFESTRVLEELNDGTTRDVTARSRMSTAAAVKKVTVRGWDPEKKQSVTGSANGVKEYTVSMDDNGVLLTSQYDNGKKEETRVTAKVSRHPHVVQYIIPLNDTDSDITEAGGETKAKITKSRSNIQNNRMTNDDADGIWSPRSNIKMIRVAARDVNGDGAENAVAAPFVPGGAVISAALRRPGDPIPGLDVKLGKNPGGSAMQSSTSDASGEFEFKGLEAGDYTFTIEQKMFIEYETLVVVGNTLRAQDHNSSRSNKTASVIAPDPGNSNTKVQDHNSSRSNKSASAVAGDPDNGKVGNVKGDVKITASQNIQSLRSISAQADLDGDGIYETDVTGKVTDEMVLNQNGDITEPQQKAGVSTSRSNIRSRSGLQPVTQNIYVGYGSAVIGGKEVPVKTVYKVVEKATSGLKDTLKTQV